MAIDLLRALRHLRLVLRAPLELRAVERALREPRFEAHRHGLDLPITTTNPALVGAASCQRDGRLRQQALEALQRLPGPIALGFVALRLNDPFAPLRDLAAAILRRRLADAPPRDVVWILPLLDGTLPRLHVDPHTWSALLLARTDLGPALLAALEDPATELRHSAFRWCTRHGPAVPADTFRTLLRDPDPGLRRQVAAIALRDGDADLHAQLRSDPDPHVRLLGLRALQHDADGLLAHLFDPRANNRFHIRMWLHDLGVDVEPRRRALEALHDPDHQIGALGLLAEVGRGADLPAVEALLEHPRAAVRREARRTQAMLLAYEA